MEWQDLIGAAPEEKEVKLSEARAALVRAIVQAITPSRFDLTPSAVRLDAALRDYEAAILRAAGVVVNEAASGKQ